MRAQARITGGVTLARLLKQPKVTCPLASAGSGATGGARAADCSRHSRPAGAAAVRCRAFASSAGVSHRSVSIQSISAGRTLRFCIPTHLTCTGAGHGCSNAGPAAIAVAAEVDQDVDAVPAAIIAAIASSSSGSTSRHTRARARKRAAMRSPRGFQPVADLRMPPPAAPRAPPASASRPDAGRARPTAGRPAAADPDRAAGPAARRRAEPVGHRPPAARSAAAWPHSGW